MMCGIFGYLTSTSIDQEHFKQQIKLLRHRGPDDFGSFFSPCNDGREIGLGHQRLSIIDLSSEGHQPMSFDDLTLVYNGEVYNFLELRNQLKSFGYTFKSNSDTEVVLKAFHKWGTNCFAKFNGMFALAIWNKKKQQLILARDRIGIKPLYYYQKGDTFLFASELKPMIAHQDFKKELSYEALGLFLYYGYITAPLSIFQNAYKLAPGKFLIYQNKIVRLQSYWILSEKWSKRKISKTYTEEEELDALDELLTSSVKYRMISDVPLGIFLSGGYDSSLITAIAQKIAKDKINTFTIGFREQKYNEANYAKAIANHLKTNYHENYISIKDAIAIIPHISKFYDEPFADSSQLPTMLVSKFARQKVKVILSGDGGDEFFCGYLSYRAFDFLKKCILPFILLNPILKLSFIKKALGAINPYCVALDKLTSCDDIVNVNFWAAAFYLNTLIKDYEVQVHSKYLDILSSTDHIQEKAMLQNMITWLPDDILTKVDRATMSESLEARLPLLDHRLMEFTFNLPHKYKCHNRTQKYLLRKLAYRYIPKNLLERPKKGFSIPLSDWLQSDLAGLIKKYLGDDYLFDQGIFDMKIVDGLLAIFKRNDKNNYFSTFIWNLLIFQLWFEEYF